MPNRDAVELSWADFRLVLRPAAGGSVGGFSYRGVPLLQARPARGPGRNEPLNLAAFPLIPFASRISGNRFLWPGPPMTGPTVGLPAREIHLAPNMPGEPLAIHGQSWRHPWDAEALADGGCLLTYHHQPDDWPWRYRARQRFTPRPDGFLLTLELANTGRAAMPGGLGWHPYLTREDARLSAGVSGRIRGAGDPPGPRRIPHPGFRSAEVRSLTLDHGFYDWQGTVDVQWPAARLGLTLSAGDPLNHLIIYTPPAAAFFCVEPVSHLPDAANWQDDQPNGWRTLNPGEALRATISIAVQRRD